MTNLYRSEPVTFAAPKKVTAAAVTALAASTASQIADLAQALSDGELDTSEFVSQVRALLLAAGQDASVGLSDDAFVEALVDGRMEHLDGFADDVKSGISAAAIAARAALWGSIAWTAYQMAKGQAAPDDAEVWYDGPDDGATCDDCAERIAGSPYTRDTMPGYPGENVQCMGNDRCNVRFETPAGTDAGEFSVVVFTLDADTVKGATYALA